MSKKGEKNSKDRPKTSVEGILRTLKSAKRLLSFATRNFPVLTLGTLITILINSAFPIAEAWTLGKLFDTLIQTATTDKELTPELFRALGLVILISSLSGVFMRLNYYFDSNLKTRINLKISELLSFKVARLDQEYFDDPKTSDLINKVSSKSESNMATFLRDMFNISNAVFGILLNLTVLISLTPLIIIISVIISIPESIVGLHITKRVYELYEKMTEMRRDARSTHGTIFNETKLREVKTFSLIDYMVKRYINIDTDYTNKNLKIRNLGHGVRAIIGVLQQLGFGIIIIILTTYVIAGKITLGSLTFYINSTTRLRQSIERLMRYLSQAYETGLYVNDFFELMDLEPRLKNGNIRIDNFEIPPKIEFKNVWFKYPNGENYVIKKFNLKLKPGEHLAMVGDNGAGKTTLIKLLMRLYDPTKGAILVNGVNLKDIELNDWYKMVGTLFQEYNFYHFDAKTNIGVGNVENMENLSGIENAAISSGAHDFIEKYEYKYDQILDKSFTKGINPSTGQKQRIALARAFFRGAPILVLDEPTSSIDAKAEYEIFEKLFDFAKNKSVIIISHRFSTVRNAERIIVLEKGEIAEEGAHEELVSIPDGKYKTAFEIQKKGYE